MPSRRAVAATSQPMKPLPITTARRAACQARRATRARHRGGAQDVDALQPIGAGQTQRAGPGREHDPVWTQPRAVIEHKRARGRLERDGARADPPGNVEPPLGSTEPRFGLVDVLDRKLLDSGGRS